LIALSVQNGGKNDLFGLDGALPQSQSLSSLPITQFDSISSQFSFLKIQTR
jgi:hypothetical protein